MGTILENSVIFSRRFFYQAESSIFSEYLIYDNSASYGRIVSFVFSINEVYADTIWVDFTLEDSSTITKSFENTVKEINFSFKKSVTHIRMYYKEISPLNTLRIINGNSLGRQIELHILYNGCGNSALQKEWSSSGSLAHDIVFVPYHAGIKKCELLIRSHANSYSSGFLCITDRLGIRHYSDGLSFYYTERNMVVSNWGEITFYNIDYLMEIPTGDTIELPIETRMDNAASVLGLYSIENVLTDRWFPSHNGCFPLKWPQNGNSPKITLVDDKNNHISDNSDLYSYIGQLYLKDFINNDSKIIELNAIDEIFTSAIGKGTRIGLLISPSTVPTKSQTVNNNMEDSTNTYYTFPTWMLNILKQSSSSENCPRLYRVSKSDVYDPASNIYMYYLNWANPTTRKLFKDCIDLLYNCLSTRVIEGKKIYDYIDYIKVAFAGTWGEGLSLELDDTNVDYPSYNDLKEISDYIKNKFSDKIAIYPLGTELNAEFPLGYRDTIMDGDNGIFFDGVSNMSRYFFQRGNYQENTGGYIGNKRLSAATPDKINEACLYSKDHVVYLECEQYFTDSVKPSYADLEVYAKYFSPDYLNLRNIFLNGVITIQNIQQRDNLYNTLRRVSHYVGTRPYIVINETYIEGARLVVRFSIGNYGTAKFREYWTLKLYAKNGATEQLLSHGFSLDQVPAPFEPGIPNFYDTVMFNQMYNLSFVPTHVLIAIEDNEGIYSNLPFCNTVESLPQEQGTGRYYLL
ncbi:MAG: hypothetical protein IJV36_01145 [Prevotella sp.]|nr:hypothetical protein [Prevotella sp.]